MWDDRYLVEQNPFFRSPIFAFEVFRHHLFLDSPSQYYRPTQNWSYMVDYVVWRGNPVGYHLTNVLLHGISAVLLYRLLCIVLPRVLGNEARAARQFIQRAALIVALTWAVHPVHSAAVAYISGRADSLASVLALTAWLLWLRSQRVTGRMRIAGLLVAALCVVLALCSKEIALLWLLLFASYLVICDYDCSPRVKWTTLASIVSLLLIYIAMRSIPPAVVSVPSVERPLGERIVLMLQALGDYCSLLFFPDRLTMDRTLTSGGPVSFCGIEVPMSRKDALVWGGVLAVCTLMVLTLTPNRGRRLRGTGALVFVVCFLPISNLFSLNAQVAEHWIYLASIGFFIFVAGCIVALPQRLFAACPLLIFATVCAFAVRTTIRASDWVDLVTFYSRTIQSGGGTPRIHVNLASAYGARGDYTQQEKILRATLRRFPKFLPAQLSLGECLIKQGRVSEAEPLLSHAKAIESTTHNFADAWFAALGLARLRQHANDHQSALEMLCESRRRFPEVWPLVAAEARSLEATRGASAAIPLLEEYARRHWWHMASQAELARLLLMDGQYDAAVALMRHASRLDIHDPNPLADIARIELQRNRLLAALAAQQAAIRRDSTRPSQYQTLAGILSLLARKDEAALALKRAEALRASVALN